MKYRYPGERYEIRARNRLKKLLARPLPDDENDVGVAGKFEPWDAFDNIVGAYNSELDLLAIRALEAIRDKRQIQATKGENGAFTEFFFNVLCGHEYMTYGMSPRGCFPASDEMAELLPRWIEKWRALYHIRWGEECPE